MMDLKKVTIMEKIFILLVIILTSSFPVFSQEKKEGEGTAVFRGEKTEIKNPFDLRDPFRPVSFKQKKKIGLNKNFSYSNIEDMDDVNLDQLRIVGVFVGKNRRAVAEVKGRGGGPYILKEGMILGENRAEIKAILPGGVVLVEKIRNVYDQEEFLETILPVTAP